MLLNRFHAAGLFLYPVITSESLWILDFFEGLQKDEWHETNYRSMCGSHISQTGRFHMQNSRVFIFNNYQQ